MEYRGIMPRKCFCKKPSPRGRRLFVGKRCSNYGRMEGVLYTLYTLLFVSAIFSLLHNYTKNYPYPPYGLKNRIAKPFSAMEGCVFNLPYPPYFIVIIANAPVCGSKASLKTNAAHKQGAGCAGERCFRRITRGVCTAPLKSCVLSIKCTKPLYKAYRKWYNLR